VLAAHGFAQRGGGDDGHVAAVAEDVHQQFGLLAVGHAQFEAAVVERAALLVGVPFFLGHPAAAFGAEVQHGPFHLGAGKDAVAAAEFAVEGGFVDVAGVAVEDFGAVDGVDGEAAQAAAQVAPGIQVPVVAVVDEALGRDFAAGGRVGAAGVVFDDEAPAAQGGGADGLEVFELEAARAHGLDADAPGDFGGRVVGAAENAPEPVEQRPDVGAEQAAAVQVGEQVLHCQQGVDFFGAEPQAGQFKLGAEVVVGAFEPVAALFAVEDHRCAEGVAHVADVAGEGGAGDAEFVLQIEGGNGAAVAEQTDEVVQPVGGDQAQSLAGVGFPGVGPMVAF
jgi:hypothetical protein